MTSKKRRIFLLTGARSEYDILYPVLERLSLDPRVEIGVVAVGAQLSPFHGLGIAQIESDGFPVVGKIESLLSSESWQGRSLSFACLIEGLTRLLDSNRPDVICVAGDREEALAAALVANFLGIFVAHLFGGDRCVASDIDEVLRPAISKLSHLHFTASEEHRKRLVRMGEDGNMVWATGGTGLDRLRTAVDISDADLSRLFGVDVKRPFFLLIHHPSPMFGTGNSGEEMDEILRGILSLDVPVFCSYPNFDPGNMSIRRSIDDAKVSNKNLIVYHNLSRDVFASLYRRCSGIVGNSSSIVIESGYLRVPGLLVGHRQDLREVGPNVVRVEATADAVAEGCRMLIEDGPFLKQRANWPSIYGDGHAAKRVAKILAEVDLSSEMLRKTMPY